MIKKKTQQRGEAVVYSTHFVFGVFFLFGAKGIVNKGKEQSKLHVVHALKQKRRSS